ncbi:MAG: hypothetical protein J5940_03065 [Clostridia bacterium]|nr:hypothetical protein [Clostridia bacterium]
MKKIKELLKLKPVRIAAVSLLISVILGSTVYSWYFYQRQVAASAEIDSPMSIYINAAHKEDIIYLDMAGINMEEGDHKDFVFAVQGEYIRAFKLQLAYTTNNQLTFEIYEASESSGAGGLVEFEAPSGGTYSYNMIGASPLSLVYKNAQAGNLLANDTLHAQTYGSYDNVETHAEPIYCQTASSVSVRNRDGVRFHNFFILRVIWPEGKTNDKETDLLYISAKASS